MIQMSILTCLDPQLLTGHKGNIKSAVLDSSGQKIFSGGDDKIIR